MALRLVSLDHYQDPSAPLAQYTWTYEGGGTITSDSDLATIQAALDALPDHVWTFDTAFLGRLTQMTSPDGIADYRYDPAGQLIGATYDYQADESYSYGPNGNRTNQGYVTVAGSTPDIGHCSRVAG